MAITQVISTIHEAGHRGVDSRDDFVTKQEAFQDALVDTFVTEINAFRTQANALETNVNAKEASAVIARDEAVQARNEAVGAAATLPDGIINDGTVSTTDTWSSDKISKLATYYIGDVIETARTLESPAWLPCNSGVYLQASYPELFSLLGTVINTKTKLDNPTTLPTDAGYGVAFSPDGVYMSVAHYTSPYVTIYKRSGDTFSKLDNPTTLPTGNGLGVAFSPDGVYMSVAHETSPYVTMYKLKTYDQSTQFALEASNTPNLSYIKAT